MVNFNDFSLMSQLPQGGPTMNAPAPAPAPQPAPQSRLPGILGHLFGGNFNPGIGLLAMLSGKKKTPEPQPTVIDQRPEDMQRLVSMFNRGGQ